MNNAYCYYTPLGLARQIMELIPQKQYTNAIDICCGSWNLLRAAKEKLPNLKCTGVDVDNNVASFAGDSNFILCDGRSFALNEYEKNQRYDLVLSNPPFGSLEKRNRVFEECSINLPELSILHCRYEHEMMLANVLLSNVDGVLVAILPITFVTGESSQKTRTRLATKFNLNAIIELPEDTFGKGNIKACALILERNEPTPKIQDTMYYLCKKEKWSFSTKGILTYEAICEGEWSIESLKLNGQNEQPLEESPNIIRGNIDSTYFNKRGEVIYHCSSIFINGHWVPGQRHFSYSKAQKTGRFLDKVEYGDILINRIGKHAGYWCIVKNDAAPITDCIIAIRKPSGNTIRKLLAYTNNGRLKIPMRGTTTRFITKQDIENIVLF